MENFILYLYYRSQDIKNRFLQLRAETPVAFLPGLNCASLLIFIMKLLTLLGIISIGFTTIPSCIVMTCFFPFLFVFLVPLYLYVNKKKVHQTIDAFKQETTDERKRNGRKIRRYIFISLIAIVVVFLL
jgi:hypothetical protein